MKEVFVILILFAGTVVPFAYPLHHPHKFTRRLKVEAVIKPPKAKKVKHEMEMFGDVRVDNYYWLRDDNGSDPQVLSYINEENNYTDLIMSVYESILAMLSHFKVEINAIFPWVIGTKNLQDQIFAEISAQSNKVDITAPRRRGPYYYYERYLGETVYYQYCRRLAPNGGGQPSVYDVMPTGPDSPPEHVILDESLRAQGQTYYNSGPLRVSPNHKLAVFTEDTKGYQNYTAYVIDAESRKQVGTPLVGLTNIVTWAGNASLLYTTMDATYRRNKLHQLGEEQSNDLCLYHETDENFSLRIDESESQKFVFVGSESIITRFIFYFDIANPEHGLIPLTPRIDGIETSVNHRGAHFFIKRRSDELYNSEVVACPVENVSAFTVIMPHRESVKITSVQLFSDHLVAFGRENGLTKVIIFNLPPLGEPIQMLQRAHDVEFMDPDYTVHQLNSDFSSNILRFLYGTLRTPNTVFDYDMNTGISVIKKTAIVLGGFDSSNYFTERKWATASDGTQVPMSIVYKKDLKKIDGSNPLLLYGYGSYEVSIDTDFSASMLPLLDRGFIYVIAHVRGGGEMGGQWHKNGQLLKKRNTFSDFITCAEFLIEMKYCTKEKLVIDGVYAGGLLIGVVLNMRPDLFKVAIAEVPFLDVVTTMLDQTNPEITSEMEEFGDPHDKESYHYMKSYSPVDNVSAQKYPSILVMTEKYPSRLKSGSAKFVAKLRDMKTDKNMLLFKCEFSDGQSTKSWRLRNLKEEAFKFTFILKVEE